MLPSRAQAQHVPADAELGLHLLSYCDPGHKHVIEPKDTKLMVDLTNALVAAIKHPIAWIHMPVPRERDDVAYFAPLKGLKLGHGTELYLGLVHLTDGIDGARRRLAAAKQVVGDFGSGNRMRLWPSSARDGTWFGRSTLRGCGLGPADLPDTAGLLIPSNQILRTQVT